MKIKYPFICVDEQCGDKICENGGICRNNACYCTGDYEGTTCSKKKITTVALVAIIVTCVLLIIVAILVICIIRNRRFRRQTPLIENKSRRFENFETLEEEPRINIAEADIQENLRRHSQNQNHGVQTITQATPHPYPLQPLSRLSQNSNLSTGNGQEPARQLSHLANGTTVSETLVESSAPQSKTPMDVVRRERPVAKPHLTRDENATIASAVKIHSDEPLAATNYLTPRSTSRTSSSTDRFSNGASFWYPAYLGGPTSGMGSSFVMMGSNNSLSRVPTRK